jgi:Sec-independent protein secretion pathway component TatC
MGLYLNCQYHVFLAKIGLINYEFLSRYRRHAIVIIAIVADHHTTRRHHDDDG